MNDPTYERQQALLEWLERNPNEWVAAGTVNDETDLYAGDQALAYQDLDRLATEGYVEKDDDGWFMLEDGSVPPDPGPVKVSINGGGDYAWRVSVRDERDLDGYRWNARVDSEDEAMRFVADCLRIVRKRPLKT